MELGRHKAFVNLLGQKAHAFALGAHHAANVGMAAARVAAPHVQNAIEHGTAVANFVNTNPHARMAAGHLYRAAYPHVLRAGSRLVNRVLDAI